MHNLLLAGGSTVQDGFPGLSTVWATNRESASIAPESQHTAVFNYLEACDFRGNDLRKTTLSRTKEKIFSHKSCNQS